MMTIILMKKKFKLLVNLNKKKKFERPSRIMISIPISDCSFDETSMDSCPLAAIGDETRGNDLSKDGNEVEVTSLEEAKSVIAALRARQRAQAHQMLAWRRTLKLQVRRKRGSKLQAFYPRRYISENSLLIQFQIQFRSIDSFISRSKTQDWASFVQR